MLNRCSHTSASKLPFSGQTLAQRERATGSLRSPATKRFVTFNCRTLSSPVQKEALDKMLSHLACPLAALQETRIRDQPVINTDRYTLFCGDANAQGVGGCAIAVHKDYASAVTEFRSPCERLCAARLTIGEASHLWLVSAHSPTEAAEESVKDVFYDQLLSLVRSLDAADKVIVGIDANCSLGQDLQADALGNWFHPVGETSDNGYRLVDFCEATDHVIASTLCYNKRRHQLTWMGPTQLSENTQRDRRMVHLRRQLDFILTRGLPQSALRKCRSVWDVSFDSDHRPVVMTFVIHSDSRKKTAMRIRKARIDSTALRDPSTRECFRKRVGVHMGARTKKKLTDADSFATSILKAAKESLPTIRPQGKYSYTSVETRHIYNQMCECRKNGDFRRERRLRGKLRRMLRKDRDGMWNRRADELELAWQENNPRKVYALLRMYSGKLKGGTQVLTGPNGLLVGPATLPVWQRYFDGLLNRPPPQALPLMHQPRANYQCDTSAPSEEEICAVVEKMKNNKASGDDEITSEMLKALPPSGIRELVRVIHDIWESKEVPDSWRNAIIVPLHKKSSTTVPSNYRGISLLRVTYKLLERLVLERLSTSREQRARDEQAGFRPGRSTIDQVFILRRMIEMRQRFQQPMHVAFLDFEAAFDSPDRSRLFEALRAEGVPESLVRLLVDMNRASTAVVRTAAGTTEAFEVRTGVRQGSVAGPFLFNVVVDDVMRRVADRFPAEITLYPSGRPLLDLDYADDIAIITRWTKRLQEVTTAISETAAAYGLRLRAEKCKQMFTVTRPAHGVQVNGQEIELVSEFPYLGCLIQNNGAYEKDLAQRCAKATSAFNSLTRCLWSTRISNTVKLRVYITAVRPIMMYGSETWAASRTAITKLDVTERKLLRRLLGHFWPDRIHNKDLYREVDELYNKVTRGRHSRLLVPSEECVQNRLRLLGHILRRPDGRLVKDALLARPPQEWRRPPGRSRKFWTEAVREDLVELGLQRDFGRDRAFRRLWNSQDWIEAVRPIAEDRMKWSALCARRHGGEDAL